MSNMLFLCTMLIFSRATATPEAAPAVVEYAKDCLTGCVSTWDIDLAMQIPNKESSGVYNKPDCKDIGKLGAGKKGDCKWNSESATCERKKCVSSADREDQCSNRACNSTPEDTTFVKCADNEKAVVVAGPGCCHSCVPKFVCKGNKRACKKLSKQGKPCKYNKAEKKCKTVGETVCEDAKNKRACKKLSKQGKSCKYNKADRKCETLGVTEVVCEEATTKKACNKLSKLKMDGYCAYSKYGGGCKGYY